MARLATCGRNLSHFFFALALDCALLGVYPPRKWIGAEG
jgi:hypothetical protein